MNNYDSKLSTSGGGQYGHNAPDAPDNEIT